VTPGTARWELRAVRMESIRHIFKKKGEVFNGIQAET
jgi:hypothetical protein